MIVVVLAALLSTPATGFPAQTANFFSEAAVATQGRDAEIAEINAFPAAARTVVI